MKKYNTSIEILEIDEIENREIIILHKLNEVIDLQDYLNNLNERCNNDSIIYLFAYTLENWRLKNHKKLIFPVLGFFYKLFCFVSFRVLPRYFNSKILIKTFSLKNRTLMSKAELMGRLTLAGFEILEVTIENFEHRFLVKKKKPSIIKKVGTGFLIKLQRVGKNGKLFNVYKFRTMHPYSEFIHSYMIVQNGFSEKGKIKNDFRATKWARILRKYWIDEIPQIINILKGDMKLIGLRPVSKSYLESLPVELIEARNKFKPGCIPPYLSLNKSSSIGEVIYSEKKYLTEFEKNKWIDVKYFFLAVYNIIFKNKRSS